MPALFRFFEEIGRRMHGACEAMREYSKVAGN